jgi:hypothetical protein
VFLNGTFDAAGPLCCDAAAFAAAGCACGLLSCNKSNVELWLLTLLD